MQSAAVHRGQGGGDLVDDGCGGDVQCVLGISKQRMLVVSELA